MSELNNMCMTYNHAFGLMDSEEKNELRYLLSGLYEHHVLPLETQLKEAKRKEKVYREFCNSLFFDIDPKDERLMKLKEQLKEQG